MSATDPSAYIARGLYYSFNGVQLRGVQSFSGLGGTGTIPQIDISDLSSEGRVYAPGIPDSGTASLNGMIDPSSPEYQEILRSATQGLIYELRMVVGGKPANAVYTDGSPIINTTFPAASGPAAPVGLTAAAGKLTVAKTQAAQLQGVVPGHYIQSGSAFGTSTKITGVTVKTNGDVDLEHAGSAISIGTNSVRVVRPAWEVRRLAYVSQESFEGAIDSAITNPLVFQLSGINAPTIGDPSITI